VTSCWHSLLEGILCNICEERAFKIAESATRIHEKDQIKLSLVTLVVRRQRA